MLPWLILAAAFGAMFCWGFGDFFIQRTVKRVGTLEALALIGIVGSVALLPFVLKDLPLLFAPRNLLLLGCLGIATFLTAVLNFEALRAGKLAVVEILLTLELPLTILLSIIIFNESLTIVQAIVIAAVFLGIVLLSLQSSPFGQHLRWEHGVLLGLLTALLYSFINFLTAAASRQTTPLLAVWLPWVIFTILSFVAIWQRHGFRAMLIHTEKWHWLVAAMGLFDTVAWVCYALATHVGEVSVVTAITESYPVIALLLGVWLNRSELRSTSGSVLHSPWG